MQDERKRRARAAWKRRQERKRQRNACAECEARAQMKPEGLAGKISKVWERLKGARVTISEGAAAKGLPPWAAISAGPKVRRLRCRRSPATTECVEPVSKSASRRPLRFFKEEVKRKK